MIKPLTPQFRGTILESHNKQSKELDKVRKQVRDNFGTFDTTKANKLNKKLKKKSNALKNHVL